MIIVIILILCKYGHKYRDTNFITELLEIRNEWNLLMSLRGKKAMSLIYKSLLHIHDNQCSFFRINLKRITPLPITSHDNTSLEFIWFNQFTSQFRLLKLSLSLCNILLPENHFQHSSEGYELQWHYLHTRTVKFPVIPDMQ